MRTGGGGRQQREPGAELPCRLRARSSVGATDEADALALFSSYGPWVQVAAPGVGIWSTTRGSYTAEDGTSFAAPHVAGAAAVLLSHDPTLTPAAAVDLLRSTGDPIRTSLPLAPGAGRINLAGALRRVAATPVLAAVRPIETRMEHNTVGSASVSLTGPAPEGGARILLSGVPADGLRLPEYVLLPQGARGGTFTYVAADRAAATSVTLFAEYRGVRQSARILVTPRAVLVSSLAVTPTRVVGGNTATGTVTLNRAAPEGGLEVSLAGASPVVVVPAQVRVLSGQNTATFPVTTSRPNDEVSATLTARLNDSTASAALRVVPRLAGLALTPVEVRGGAVLEAIVTLHEPAPTGGLLVRLSREPARFLAAPARVRVPEGASSARFAVHTRRVTGPTSVALTAELDGVRARATATLTR